MNILLWIAQILLALWNTIGGYYMVNNYQNLANKWALGTLPKTFWLVLGLVQILFALGLIVPGVVGLPRYLIIIPAVGIVVISLLGIGLYTKYAGFPGMLWGILPALLAAFVIYGRMVKG